MKNDDSLCGLNLGAVVRNILRQCSAPRKLFFRKNGIEVFFVKIVEIDFMAICRKPRGCRVRDGVIETVRVGMSEDEQDFHADLQGKTAFYALDSDAAVIPAT